jgi:mRNA interferase MazF
VGRVALPGKTYPRQGEVWWVNLDPSVGREITKKRPCLVVSPDDMNAYLGTVIAAPITSTVRDWPSRVTVLLQRQQSSIALDQMRAVDLSRLIKKMTTIDPEPALEVLREMFAKA